MRSQRKRSINTKSAKKSPKKSKIDENSDFCEPNISADQTTTNGFELYGYETELKYLKKIVNNTITTGESNSVLICGDPGSGKTVLVETCLKQIETNPNVSIIRLNGFVNSNDLNTIKTIGTEFGINANTITDIMEQLKNKCNQNSYFRSVIVLDRFDIFCRRNQTLLYNLFDVLQNCDSICIIGMTARLDSIDLLEKRVKSRLNQRIIQLITPFADFDAYMSFAIKKLNGREPTDSLRESLKIQFSLNYSIRELNRLLLDDLVSHKTGIESTVGDTKLSALSELSKYEISVLLIANKYTKNQNRDHFHCSAILDALRHLPQIKINKNMLFKIIYKLIEIDLITRYSSTKKTDLLLSEWTLFALNIDDSHLNQILNSNSFPNYIKQI